MNDDIFSSSTSPCIQAAQDFASDEDTVIVLQDLDKLTDAEIVEGVRFASFLFGVEWAKDRIEKRLSIYKREFDTLKTHTNTDILHSLIIELEEIKEGLERE